MIKVEDTPHSPQSSHIILIWYVRKREWVSKWVQVGTAHDDLLKRLGWVDGIARRRLLLSFPLHQNYTWTINGWWQAYKCLDIAQIQIELNYKQYSPLLSGVFVTRTEVPEKYN